MNVSREDALAIIEMASVCYSEGIGPDYTSLLTRLRAAFPGVEAGYEYMPEFSARVITRAMDDGK